MSERPDPKRNKNNEKKKTISPDANSGKDFISIKLVYVIGLMELA
jgi:hypothetical protein